MLSELCMLKPSLNPGSNATMVSIHISMPRIRIRPSQSFREFSRGFLC
jgi:hypothetical protein